jgi:hypothetical protein
MIPPYFQNSAQLLKTNLYDVYLEMPFGTMAAVHGGSCLLQEQL